MKKFLQYKLVLMIAVFFLSTGMIGESGYKLHENKSHKSDMELLYDNIWGTIYNPEVRQCDETPTITGDGSIINADDASSHRWIAISQEMLYCLRRAQIINDPFDSRFKGKIGYGDTVWIVSPHEKINGMWVVHDAKNALYTNSIDFLQTKGDGSLYDNNPLWSGKFEDIKIYRFSSGIYDKNKLASL